MAVGTNTVSLCHTWGGGSNIIISYTLKLAIYAQGLVHQGFPYYFMSCNKRETTQLHQQPRGTQRSMHTCRGACTRAEEHAHMQRSMHTCVQRSMHTCRGACVQRSMHTCKTKKQIQEQSEVPGYCSQVMFNRCMIYSHLMLIGQACTCIH